MRSALFFILFGLLLGIDFSNRNLEPVQIVTTKIVDQHIYHEPKVKKFTITAYSLRKKECNNDLKNTATMVKPIVGVTAAVSRDNLHLLGKTIYIEGYGVRKVTDVMNKRFKNRIDLLMTLTNAKQFGIKKAQVTTID